MIKIIRNTCNHHSHQFRTREIIAHQLRILKTKRDVGSADVYALEEKLRHVETALQEAAEMVNTLKDMIEEFSKSLAAEFREERLRDLGMSEASSASSSSLPSLQVCPNIHQTSSVKFLHFC